MLYYSVVSVGSAKVYAAHKNVDSTSAFWFSQVWSLNRDYFIIQSFRVFCLVVSQHGSATVQCKFISQHAFLETEARFLETSVWGIIQLVIINIPFYHHGKRILLCKRNRYKLCFMLEWIQMLNIYKVPFLSSRTRTHKKH